MQVNFSLGSCVFSWSLKKQQSVAQSSAEEEYVSTATATSQAIWLKRILEDIGEKQEESILALGQQINYSNGKESSLPQ
jgi:hypothetical protein